MSQVQTLATFVSQTDEVVTVTQCGNGPFQIPKDKIAGDDVEALVSAADGQEINIRIDQAFCDQVKLA